MLRIQLVKTQMKDWKSYILEKWYYFNLGKKWFRADRRSCFGSVPYLAGKAWRGAGWGMKTRSWCSCAGVTSGDSELKQSHLGPGDEMWLGIREEAVLPASHGTQHSGPLKTDSFGGVPRDLSLAKASSYLSWSFALATGSLPTWWRTAEERQSFEKERSMPSSNCKNRQIRQRVHKIVREWLGNP